MSKKRAEIRRMWRHAWMRWFPMNEDRNDRRVIAPPCDWPGSTRQERRETWLSAWAVWLEETCRAQEEKEAA